MMLDASPIWGLVEGSKVTEAIVRHDGTATRYRVTKEKLNLGALQLKRDELARRLEIPEPTEQEIIEAGRSSHTFYTLDRDRIQSEIDLIDSILGQ